MLQTIILLGAVQGFILSGLLFFSTTHRRPNRLLAVLLLLMALASLRLEKGYRDFGVDIDNTDSRYKSEDEIKNAVDQYMDTVINKK